MSGRWQAARGGGGASGIDGEEREVRGGAGLETRAAGREGRQMSETKGK